MPIQNKKVCGLHVEANLQILTKSENIRKHEKFNKMNISEQLKSAGIEVIIDVRKLKAALKAGKSVIVMDSFEKILSATFNIRANHNHLHCREWNYSGGHNKFCSWPYLVIQSWSLAVRFIPTRLGKFKVFPLTPKHCPLNVPNKKNGFAIVL